MADERRRENERRAAQGDVQAAGRVLLDRLRAGELRRTALEAAAYLGDPAALNALGANAPCELESVNTWVRGLGEFDYVLPLRAAMAAALPVLEAWEAAHVGPRPQPEPRDIYDAAQVWLRCPCDPHGLKVWDTQPPGEPCSPLLLIGRGMHRHVSFDYFMGDSVREARAVLGEEVVRSTIRAALVPWLLDGTLRAWHFPALSVRLAHGDIARSQVDGIANAANDQLLMQGGVAAALRAAGGVAIEREAAAHAPAPLGSVVRTTAGRLGAEHVFHAVVIRYSLVGGTRAPDVRVAVQEVVKQSQDLRLSTLALPLFGAGVGGLSVEQSLETILDGLEAVPNPGGCRRLYVEVVVLDAEEWDDAERAWRAYQPKAERDAEASLSAEHYLRLLESGMAGLADRDSGDKA